MKKIIVALLMVMCLFMATSCVPKNMEKAKAKMEKAGYTCQILNELEVAAARTQFGDLDSAMSALKTEGDYANIYLYKTKDAANENVEKIKKLQSGTAFEVFQSGKWVVIGLGDSIKNFKK